MSSRTDVALGKMKQTVGDLTHNRSLKRRGMFEVAKGRARHLIGTMRKSVKRVR
jgi:uncharacterized protein YjbJ (UPF0337 family)